MFFLLLIIVLLTLLFLIAFSRIKINIKNIKFTSYKVEERHLQENYDIEVHNRNMDKIDSAIQEVKGKVDGLELTAQRVSIADPTNKFEATNVEDALLENKTSILNKVDIVVTQDKNISRKDKTFYFIVTDKQSTGDSSINDVKVSPNMGIKII